LRLPQKPQIRVRQTLPKIIRNCRWIAKLSQEAQAIPKSETRISKSEANPNFEIKKRALPALFLIFFASNFEFASDFEIRVSDF
jgi:hypothetical protein